MTQMTAPMPTEVPVDVVDAVRERLARRPGSLTPHRVAEALREAGRPVGDATVLAVHEALVRDVVGAGPLEPLLRTPGVTDVLVNGPDAVYLDRGAGLEQTSVRFPDDESVRRLAQRLAASGGRRLDDASPYVDVRLADGTRCHAVLAPVGAPGTLISLRVPRPRGFSLDELVVRPHAHRRGGTAAAAGGPTAAGLPGQRRHRLRQDHPARLPALGWWIRPSAWCSSRTPPSSTHATRTSSPSRSRPPNIEGAGEITLRTLVRQALRMRPDRLVVGEVRGGEVVELLAALNTGHDGGCGTLHANSAGDVPARIEALALAAGLGRDATHSQLASAVDVVLHLGRRPDGTRTLREVAVPAAGRRRTGLDAHRLSSSPTTAST